MTNQRKTAVQDFGYRLPRFPADFGLVLQISDPEPRLLDGRCRDISEDGLAARISESLSVGTRVTLLLTLPGKAASLPIAATVSHQDRGNTDSPSSFRHRTSGNRFRSMYLPSAAVHSL